MSGMEPYPDTPWDWDIYLHGALKPPQPIGIYGSPMECLGYIASTDLLWSDLGRPRQDPLQPVPLKAEIHGVQVGRARLGKLSMGSKHSTPLCIRIVASSSTRNVGGATVP